jgi:hypothetical protein
MATSGSVDFSVSRDNILTDALIIVGAVGPDDTVPTTWTTHAARQLNKVVKALGAKRIGLWARKTGYILPVSATNSVSLGASGGHATLSYSQTTLDDDHTGSDTTLELVSVTGFGASQAVGIELDDGTIHWTTQVGAAVGNVITIASGLASDAAEGKYVYTYATKLQRPLRVVEAYRSNLEDDMDTELDIEPKAIYEAQNSKTQTGELQYVSYDPQLDNGVLYFWPQFENGKSVIKIVFQRPFEDFDAASDTPDFPAEWWDALCYLLAVRLAPVYGMPATDRQLLRQEAAEAIQLALENEPEEGSLSVQPDMGP